ncbi:Laminin subunit gamma-1 [Dissostichus eleginoides]|uniref:Laminin subunit gamma-1 n=1 Tax=Dissostichus eleginoides TaxID=100907 RepID=A0AAD9EVP5_DISEL|nr:Laminin subunit gamma-1 [Dissostichus eleginoides]
MRVLIRALVAASWVFLCARAAMDECSDDELRAQRCMPEFVNAAFNVTVVSTNTCGSPPEEYCVQTGATGSPSPATSAPPETRRTTTAPGT